MLKILLNNQKMKMKIKSKKKIEKKNTYRVIFFCNWKENSAFSLLEELKMLTPNCSGIFNNLIGTSNFDEADIVGITPVYEAGEKPIKGINSEKLISLLNNRSIVASIIDNENELKKFLKRNGKPGDIFICLGAGSISQWVNKLPDTL